MTLLFYIASFHGNSTYHKEKTKLSIFREEDGDTKNVITIKFHQQVSIVATPLVLKVLERLVYSLSFLFPCPSMLNNYTMEFKLAH